MAEQFAPLRAQFTRQFYLSEQFMDIQLTSYPLIVSRELNGRPMIGKITLYALHSRAISFKSSREITIPGWHGRSY